jgi:hypothetical protein
MVFCYRNTIQMNPCAYWCLKYGKEALVVGQWKEWESKWRGRLWSNSSKAKDCTATGHWGTCRGRLSPQPMKAEMRTAGQSRAGLRARRLPLTHHSLTTPACVQSI